MSVIISLNSVPENETCECPLCNNQHKTTQSIAVFTVHFPMSAYGVAEEMGITSQLFNPNRHNFINARDISKFLQEYTNIIAGKIREEQNKGLPATELRLLYNFINTYYNSCISFGYSKIQIS